MDRHPARPAQGPGLLRLAAMFAVFAEADDKAEIAVTHHRAAKLTALDRRGPGCIPMIIGGYVG